MLRVHDLHYYYGGVHALKGIDLEVRQGEIVTLIGANGAGKTTTLRCISGLLTPSSGEILYMDQPIQKLRPSKAAGMGIAQVLEGRHVFPHLTVEENLVLGAYSQGKGNPLKEDITKMYHRFPRLQERRKQNAGTLSGGEQQMLVIARALMSHPKLLLMDEPSLGLAPIIVEEIFHIIQEISQDGVTILLNEQNANMALAIANRGYVIETGTIALTGTGQELLGNDEVRKSYLGAQ